MTAAPDYDLAGALPAGYVMTRAAYDALATAWANGGFRPLSANAALAAVLPVLGPQPQEPAGLPRFPDSNPLPPPFNRNAPSPPT